MVAIYGSASASERSSMLISLSSLDSKISRHSRHSTNSVVAGARVNAQLGLERLADRSGLDEVDQALGEDRCLRPGGQLDSQPPGGDMVDGAAPAVSGGDIRRQ